MGVFNKVMSFLGLQEEEDASRENYDETPDLEESDFAGQRRVKNNIVSIHAQKNIRLMLTEPKSYEETQEIADHLRSRRPVLVNLQRVRSDQAVRIVDFLSGTVYALNGQISKVGPGIFICTPDNVELHGTITEMLSNQEEYPKSR